MTWRTWLRSWAWMRPRDWAGTAAIAAGALLALLLRHLL